MNRRRKKGANDRKRKVYVGGSKRQNLYKFEYNKKIQKITEQSFVL